MPWLYQLIMALAIATGVLLSRLTTRRSDLSEGQRLGVGIGAFVGAMLGAKLPFALSDWSQLLSGAAWSSDGKTILTGLAGGYLGVVVAKWSLDIQARTGDGFAMPVAASVAVGRLGCFVAGCCYGCPTSLPWGVVFRQHGSQPRHPAQLYEAVFHGLAAWALYHLQRGGLFRGNLMKLYIVAYAVYRFFSELVRDEQPLWLDLTGYQWAALALAALFAWLWWRDRAVAAELPARLLPGERAVQENAV
jgi:phosphatidylglycerol:prolipoprotein diacylglycerol transferase